MTGGKAIYHILTNSDANTLLQGRIYPELGPADAVVPFCVYKLNTTEFSDTKSGVSALDVASYDVILVDDGYSTLASLTDQVRTALDRYTGTANGVVVDSIQLVGLDTDYDAENERYLSVIDIDIRIKL